ncbi:hypothetical protein ACFLXE_07365 [Chloroflexota bacterium]
MDLQDYSGEFNPDLKFEDFSKDALVRLIDAYKKCFVGISGMYHTVNAERMGVEEAWKVDSDVYLRQQMLFELPLVTRAMNIHGNDVLALLKIFQVLPDGIREGQYECSWDIKSKDHAILTFTKCQTLFYHERHGNPKDIEGLCGPGSIEDLCFTAYGKWVNPNMQCRALTLPPRKSEKDICCVWEWKIENGSEG